MKAYGRFRAHNIIEAYTDTSWVVLDPKFGTYFVKPLSEGLASFNDVKDNWNYYKKQLPSGYNNSYMYADVRYTNWDKIPIILPVFKKMLTVFLGKERSDQVSLRVHFLRVYDLYFFNHPLSIYPYINIDDY